MAQVITFDGMHRKRAACPRGTRFSGLQFCGSRFRRLTCPRPQEIREAIAEMEQFLEWAKSTKSKRDQWFAARSLTEMRRLLRECKK